MEHAKILKGGGFDWVAGKKEMDNVIVGNDVNWGATSCADPGVMKCPECGEYYWKEGKRVQCVKCGAVFMV